MAEALSQSVENLSVEDKKLQDIFLDGWNAYEELEETQLVTNSMAFQEKVKSGMQYFEQATRIVSQLGMFSANELIDEVSTESLQYMLLPLFLGKLALKLQTDDRLNVLRVAEVYFNDYLQRCAEYDLCDSTNSNKSLATTESSGNNPELAELMRSAHSRNNKIAQYKRKKELEEQVKKLKVAVKSNAVDDEVKREFFLNFLKLGIIDAQEELSSLQLEKQMVEMHKARGEKMKPLSGSESNQGWDQQAQHQEQPSGSHGHGHSHSHSHAGHSHTHHMRMPPPQNKPKPLQPFIITRDATQKAVFGMGYPSLPVMSVDDFYKQRVQEGIFPDEEKVAKMNQAQAIAALQNENEKEDEERAVVEEQIENDDEEYLARMRRMDEYKDVVRRGDGNRHNRS